MSDDAGEKLTFYIFWTIKIIVALFVFKVVLVALGFTGYIPGADEIYNFFLKIVFYLGTGQSSISQKF